MKKIKVPLATYLLAERPDVLASYGIGSCVVVVLYDPLLKLAAMAHVMLPGRGNEVRDHHTAKYSDQAIEGMLEELAQRGYSRKRLFAKIAGGSRMFHFSAPTLDSFPGQRNVEAVMKKLAQEGIPLVAMDVGKNFGRSVEFDTETGKMTVRTIAEGIKEI